MATATDIASDPNQITDPTGGQKNFNILDVFQEFGYQPTQAEINSLSQSFSGSIDPGQIGTSAVGQYVNFMDTVKQTEANDPLTALQTTITNSVAQNKASIQGLYGQLQSTLAAAPQLFGSLTPAQISTYLQPLQTAFQSQIGQVQAAMAKTGGAGSSTEQNALAQAQAGFQGQVLSTGLSIGQQQQQAQAQAMQAQINNLFGLTGTEEQIGSAAASQQSSQNLAESNLLASLPSFFNSQSTQQEAIQQAQAAQGGFQSEFNTVTGDISQALGTATSLFNTATKAGQAVSGMTAPGISTPVPASSSTPNLSLLQGQPGTPEAYGLGGSGSMFGS